MGARDCPPHTHNTLLAYLRTLLHTLLLRCSLGSPTAGSFRHWPSIIHVFTSSCSLSRTAERACIAIPNSSTACAAPESPHTLAWNSVLDHLITPGFSDIPEGPCVLCSTLIVFFFLIFRKYYVLYYCITTYHF